MTLDTQTSDNIKFKLWNDHRAELYRAIHWYRDSFRMAEAIAATKINTEEQLKILILK